VGILKDRIAVVAGEFPPAGLDDLAVAIEGFVGGDEVESGRGSSVGCRGVGGRLADFDMHGAAETGAAVGEREEAVRKGGTLNVEP